MLIVNSCWTKSSRYEEPEPRRGPDFKLQIRNGVGCVARKPEAEHDTTCIHISRVLSFKDWKGGKGQRVRLHAKPHCGLTRPRESWYFYTWTRIHLTPTLQYTAMHWPWRDADKISSLGWGTMGESSAQFLHSHASLKVLAKKCQSISFIVQFMA